LLAPAVLEAMKMNGYSGRMKILDQGKYRDNTAIVGGKGNVKRYNM
jgi:hypothetical protein